MHSESQVRVPGRPLGFDRDEVLERLLLLFLERGYDQVNQQQMASATGLSTSSLYNTFGTKAETFHAIMRRFMEMAGDLLAPLEHGSRGREDLIAYFDGHEQMLHTDTGQSGCLVTSSMVTHAGRDEEVQALGAEHRARLRAALIATLERGRALGEPLPDPAPTSALLVAAILGNLTTARATQSGPETAEQIDALRGLVRSWV